MLRLMFMAENSHLNAVPWQKRLARRFATVLASNAPQFDSDQTGGPD
jgi:hypothetical protein